MAVKMSLPDMKLTFFQPLKFKGEKCVSGILSKECITVFVCVNMAGTEHFTNFCDQLIKKSVLLLVGKKIASEILNNQNA